MLSPTLVACVGFGRVFNVNVVTCGRHTGKAHSRCDFSTAYQRTCVGTVRSGEVDEFNTRLESYDRHGNSTDLQLCRNVLLSIYLHTIRRLCANSVYVSTIRYWDSPPRSYGRVINTDSHTNPFSFSLHVQYTFARWLTFGGAGGDR